MLSDKIEQYRGGGKRVRLTPAQYKEAYPYFKEVDSMALINVQLSLEKAFDAYKRQPSVGFPKYKSKKRSPHSYTTNRIKNNIEVGADFVKLPKLGRVRARIHRPIPCNARVKGVTVSQNVAGKYYIAVLLEFPSENPQLAVAAKTSIGLDFSIPHFFVSSDVRASHPHPASKLNERLSKAQKTLSRKRKGSKNYQKQQRKIGRIYERMACQRKDYLHKTSREIANRYDVIGVEDLNLIAISKTMKFGSRTGDSGWAFFVHCLSYKAAERGGRVVKVGKRFPSSKLCSVCGYKNTSLVLGDRNWICPCCGTRHNRDVNAAENIRHEAVRLLAC